MNIFATSLCPTASAQAIDNKRLPKMILEMAQMMSSAMHVYGVDTVYKQTHVNHPAALWLRANRHNWTWGLEHMIAMSEEHQYRWPSSKRHASMDLLDHFDDFGWACLPSEQFTVHANCTDFKDVDDVYTAYRHQMIAKWNADTPTWGALRKPPPWASRNSDGTFSLVEVFRT